MINFLSDQSMYDFMRSANLIILAITVLIHFIFAGAVSRDAGLLDKRGIRTQLVSGITWAFATLLGGVFVAAVYWLIHHMKWPSPPR